MKLEEIGNYLSNCGPNEIDELLKDWKLEEPQSAREFLEKIAPEFQKISKKEAFSLSNVCKVSHLFKAHL